PQGEGVSAMDELCVNVMNTPVEAIETEFPVRVERYELARDSGGPGTFRGGLGVGRQWGGGGGGNKGNPPCAGVGGCWRIKPASTCAWPVSSFPRPASSAPSRRKRRRRC